MDLDRELTAAVGMAAEALADTRELSRLLRPPVLDELGLEAALRWLVRRIRENSGLTVELDCASGDGRLEISDDGKGFDVSRVLGSDASSDGFGLRAIADRVELFAGKVRFDSAPGEGTTIVVRLPRDGSESR